MTVKMNVQWSWSRREQFRGTMGTSFFTTWEEKPGEAEWGWVFPWLGAAQRPFPKRSRGRPGLCQLTSGLEPSLERHGLHLREQPRQGQGQSEDTWDLGINLVGPNSLATLLQCHSAIGRPTSQLCLWPSTTTLVNLTIRAWPCLS